MGQFDISAYKIFLLKPDRIVEPASWIEHIPFAFVLIQALRPKCIVELGVHSGNSYNAFCQAVQFLGLDTKCYGVDTWIGEEHAGYYDESVFEDLRCYQRRYSPFSTLLRMTFDEALVHIPDKSVDFLHIDGLHTYEAVSHDYESWLTKISDRGVVLLHDTCVHERDFGVWRFWDEISERHESFNFTHGYGLGVILVGERQREDVLGLLHALKRNPFYKELFASQGRLISLQYSVDYRAERRDSFAQLFIDTGSGFSEAESIIVHYNAILCNGRKKRLIFDLKKYQNIKRIKFDPLDDSVVIILSDVVVIDDKSIHYQISPTACNAAFISDKTFSFDSNDPQIVFDLEADKDYVKAYFSITYLNVGLSAIITTLKHCKQTIINNDQIIADKNQEIRDKNQIIADKNQEISSQIAQLLELKYEIVQLHNSTSWRITRPLRSITTILKGSTK